jgi:hypothetical protein
MSGKMKPRHKYPPGAASPFRIGQAVTVGPAFSVPAFRGLRARVSLPGPTASWLTVDDSGRPRAVEARNENILPDPE